MFSVKWPKRATMRLRVPCDKRKMLTTKRKQALKQRTKEGWVIRQYWLMRSRPRMYSHSLLTLAPHRTASHQTMPTHWPGFTQQNRLLETRDLCSGKISRTSDSARWNVRKLGRCLVCCRPMEVQSAHVFKRPPRRPQNGTTSPFHAWTTIFCGVQ